MFVFNKKNLLLLMFISLKIVSSEKGYLSTDDYVEQDASSVNYGFCDEVKFTYNENGIKILCVQGKKPLGSKISGKSLEFILDVNEGVKCQEFVQENPPKCTAEEFEEMYKILQNEIDNRNMTGELNYILQLNNNKLQNELDSMIKKASSQSSSLLEYSERPESGEEDYISDDK